MLRGPAPPRGHGKGSDRPRRCETLHLRKATAWLGLARRHRDQCGRLWSNAEGVFPPRREPGLWSIFEEGEGRFGVPLRTRAREAEASAEREGDVSRRVPPPARPADLQTATGTTGFDSRPRSRPI